MAEPSSMSRIVRFGVFDADLQAGELRKNGLKVRLSGQPFQVLALLLERPGEVITREELQKKLWPDGTFVDFDHSLNTAINKIREALGDSAENPRFVETLARRGYRFIVPVEVVSPSIRPAEAKSASADNATPLPEDSGSGLLRPPERIVPEKVVPPKSLRAKKKIAALASAGVFLLAAAVAVSRFSRQASETAPPLKLTRLTWDSGLTTDSVISPDGKLVAYASDRSGEGNLDVWVKQVAGGEPIRLTRNAADDRFPDFSPDGSQIVFRSERQGGGIYLISTLGGEERLLAPLGRNPRFSPDGNWIAYWTGRNSVGLLGAQAGDNLFVTASAGGEPRRILEGFASAGSPIWSPDSSRLLFFGNAAGVSPVYQTDSDWWVVSREGGAAVKTGAFDALEKHQIARRFPATVPHATSWIENHVLFHAQLGDSVNLWQVSISPKTFRVEGPAQRLTSGSGLELAPSVARNGAVVFSSVVADGDIWALPVDANQGRPVGNLEQLTLGGSDENSPSISLDGKTLVFVSDRSGSPDVWLKDLEGGKETSLTGSPQLEIQPEISSNSAWVAYLSVVPQFSFGGNIQIVATRGGVPKTVCEGCGKAWDWAPDNRHLIFRRAIQGARADLYLLDLATGKKTLLLEHPTSDFFQGNFSPDGRWITFEMGRPGSRVLIAPLRGEAAIPEKEWICLSDGSSWDDKPRWSPDGNLLYFTSDRDGFVCLWAQRLDSAAKRPTAVPFVIHHFHQARRSMANVGYGPLAISVARDKIVFNMVELTGNIWMTKLELK
jgi:Tol biopolymer transport system component/DNA-binding winged helix-turn-helix (wHTH) protein